MHGIRATEFANIKPGNAAMYYPEANVLVGRTVDPLSRTPAFKCVVVRVRDRRFTCTRRIDHAIENQIALNAIVNRDSRCARSLQAFQGRRELSVLDSHSDRPVSSSASKRYRGNELPETQLWTLCPYFGESFKQTYRQLSSTHIASPIRRLFAFGRRSLPSTSTRTLTPGSSLANRVARVTPSTNSNTPSEPS